MAGKHDPDPITAWKMCDQRSKPPIMVAIEFAIGFVGIHESSLRLLCFLDSSFFPDIHYLQHQGLFMEVTHVYTTTFFEELVIISATS